MARAANQGYGNIFDLQEVFFVDSEGEEALRLLGGRGGTFIAESAYGKDLCHRLKLERIAPLGADNNDVKGREGSRKVRDCRRVHAGGLDALTAVDANQHPQRCAK